MTKPSAHAVPPTISRSLLGFFRHIVRGYFRRSFHGVRIRGAEQMSGVTGPLIVYANHSSWWDPMVSILLAEKLLPGRRHYAPMDARALERYGILKKLGIFGVALDSARGAVQFLRTGEVILRGGGVLWVTPQGRFADARERPLVFKPGMAMLAGRLEDGCTVLPLAIEYPFWNERTPECLLQVGEAVRVLPGSGGLEGRFEAALLETMEELRTVAVQRNAALFVTLNEGRAGAGGFYALGQRVRAWMTRRPYRAEHSAASAQDGGKA